MNGLWTLLWLAFLPPLSQPLTPQSWQYIGPFSAGSREGGIDHLLPLGGEESAVPHPEDTLWSPLVPGGEVTWRPVEGDSAGWVHLVFPDVDWKPLQDYYGWVGLIQCSYAYTEVSVPQRVRALAQLERAGLFYLNGIPYYGDRYGHGYFVFPVILEEGTNRILVKACGYEDASFRLRFLPPRGALQAVVKDVTAPDPVTGWEVLEGPVGVPVVNTTGEWILGARLEVAGASVPIPPMPPLSATKVPARLHLPGPFQENDTLWVPVRIRMASGEIIFRDSFPLVVFSPPEPYRITRISAIDSSVQYYAVLPPEPYQPDRFYALIFTIHGAGVEARGLARAYQPKDWAFVVAPTNRRRFGFDWEDWGRLDALETLEDALRRFPIDTNRIYLVGHSMGGHGTWVLGLHHADRWAGISPGAGWPSFGLYVPFTLQKARVLGDPLRYVTRDRVLFTYHMPAYVENALYYPVMIVHGGADDVVPPFHGRLFYGLLKALGYQVRLHEVPGQKHWWNLPETPYTDVVDFPELWEYLRSHVRNPAPDSVVFLTADLGLSDRCYWVRAIEQEELYALSRLKAVIESPTRIRVEVRNLKTFALHPPASRVSPGVLEIGINGRTYRVRYTPGEPLVFTRKGEGFKPIRWREPGKKERWKRGWTYGPIKQVFFRPFLFVYGTGGTPEETDWNLHLARLRVTEWWRRASGFARVVPDTALTPQMEARYNLILIGGPRTNRVTARYARHLPIQVREGEIRVGKRVFRGKRLVTKFVYPNPRYPDHLLLVIAATDLEGMKLARLLTTDYSGAGLPDFVVYSAEVREKGFGGVLLSGFFDTHWRLDERLMYGLREYTAPGR